MARLEIFISLKKKIFVTFSKKARDLESKVCLAWLGSFRRYERVC